MPSVSPLAACVAGMLLLSSCAGSTTTRSAAPSASPEATAAARVPLLRDALAAEACALVALPVETLEQRTAVAVRAGELVQRFDGTRGPRSDIPFLLTAMTTLGHIPKGDTFFGSPEPRPTLRSGFVMPTTLEEALVALRAECAPAAPSLASH